MSAPPSYGFGQEVAAPFDDVLARTRAALKDRGLRRAHRDRRQATMKEKLGLDRAPYTILGACNPTLAHRAIAAERELGLLLPCNVIVYATDEGAKVSAIDPGIMGQLIDNPTLAEVASEVRAKLERVSASIESRAGARLGPRSRRNNVADDVKTLTDATFDEDVLKATALSSSTSGRPGAAPVARSARSSKTSPALTRTRSPSASSTSTRTRPRRPSSAS